MSESETQQLRDAVRMGQEAQALIQSPLFKQIFAAAEQRAVDMWVNSLPEQVAVREQAYATRKAMTLVLDEAHILINRGEMAAATSKRRK